MRLPNHVFATLQAVCGRYPYRLVQDDAHLGDILNEVAWAHKDEGWGLSRKEFGTNCPSPVGLVAHDVLALQSPDLHWDVLDSAGRGYPLKPVQTDAIGPLPGPSRHWVAPVAPTTAVVPVPPTKPSVPSVDLSGLQASVLLLTQQQEALLQAVAGLPTRQDLERVQAALWGLVADVVVAEHLADLKGRIDNMRAVVDSEAQEARCRFLR